MSKLCGVIYGPVGSKHVCDMEAGHPAVRNGFGHMRTGKPQEAGAASLPDQNELSLEEMKAAVLKQWPQARLVQWMVLWPDNLKRWGYQVEGTAWQRVEPKQSELEAWRLIYSKLQPLPESRPKKFHFETWDVLAAVVGTNHLKDNIEYYLHRMTSGERYSLYRAIVKLADALPESREGDAKQEIKQMEIEEQMTTEEKDQLMAAKRFPEGQPTSK